MTTNIKYLINCCVVNTFPRIIKSIFYKATLKSSKITLQKYNKQKHLYAVPKLVCQGPSFYLNYLVKKGHNSKTIAFRVMPLVLQLPLVMKNNIPSLVLIPFKYFLNYKWT